MQSSSLGHLAPRAVSDPPYSPVLTLTTITCPSTGPDFKAQCFRNISIMFFCVYSVGSYLMEHERRMMSCPFVSERTLLPPALQPSVTIFYVRLFLF